MENYELFEAIAKKQLPLLQPVVDLINEIEGSNITTVPFGKTNKRIYLGNKLKNQKLIKELY